MIVCTSVGAVRREGEVFVTPGLVLIHKIIIHKVSNDPEAIGGAHEVFSPL